MKKIIILGIDGAIGSFLSEKLSDKFIIQGTSRNKNSPHSYIDFSDRDSISAFVNESLSDEVYGIINCYGLQKPIKSFLSADFLDWEKNITTNFANYSFFLHKIINLNLQSIRKIISFSGGGATGPRKLFSAYAISKISIYKLSEILAEEFQDLNIDINVIAPGSIKSKMTKEIISNKNILGNEFSSAQQTIDSGGDDLNNVVKLCNYLLSKDSNGITGKLIAAQWDNFDLIKKLLKEEKNLFSLRRIDNKHFYENKEIK